MVGIIVVGHGSFGTGIVSSLELIAGKQDKLVAVNFTEEDNVETLEEKLVKSINTLGKEVLVLSDLAGGSPFKVAATLSTKLEDTTIGVISGANLGMLLEVSLCREGMNVEELLSFAENSGQTAIKKFEIKKKEVVEDYEIDGI